MAGSTLVEIKAAYVALAACDAQIATATASANTAFTAHLTAAQTVNTLRAQRAILLNTCMQLCGKIA